MHLSGDNRTSPNAAERVYPGRFSVSSAVSAVRNPYRPAAPTGAATTLIPYRPA